MTPLSCKTWAIICDCFVHQHGRLMTWLESTYWLTSLPCYTLSTTGKVLEAFQGAVSFLLTFESLIKSLIIVQYQKWAKKGSIDLRVKHQTHGLLNFRWGMARVFWMTFYGVVALAEFSIALTFRYNKVLFVSESCLYHVGIKWFHGKVSDCHRFLDFWQSRRLNRHGEKPLPRFCFGGNVIFPRK